MNWLLKYFEESPVDLFSPDRYDPILPARESRIWQVEGKPVVGPYSQAASGCVPLANPPREVVTGKDHHRCVIGAGPSGRDAPVDRIDAQRQSTLRQLDRALFDPLIDRLVGDAPRAIYLALPPPHKFSKRPATPDLILGPEATILGREGLHVQPSQQTVCEALHQSLSMSGLGDFFLVVGGALVAEMAKGGLEAARARFGRVAGEAPDYLAFHALLRDGELALLPTGGNEWGRNLGVYSLAPQQARVERALLATSDEVYRVDEIWHFDFHCYPKPWPVDDIVRRVRRAG